MVKAADQLAEIDRLRREVSALRAALAGLRIAADGMAQMAEGMSLMTLVAGDPALMPRED